jgi:2-polyprenyl-6-hydroxyphenyl methylase/3-demethylubiquinone-9 3-methyltransferase
MSFMNTFFEVNINISNSIERLLPSHTRVDGNSDFHAFAMPDVLGFGGLVYDLGGGSRPCMTADDKKRNGQRLVGLDISAEELAAAPPGVYDKIVTADLCSFLGPEDGDVVICQATLEHVPDTVGAIRAISSCLRPGGRAAIFAPCRNAVFARLNLLIPQDLKKKLLFFVFPEKSEGHDGFKAYYDHCTPGDIERIAAENGLIVERRRIFWVSSYFKAFLPAYLLWRIWQGLAWLFIRDQAAEAFWYILRKRDATVPASNSIPD